MLSEDRSETRQPMDTRERLLEAAEKLFAERGIGNTSLREITHLARANLAAVNYHFQSKGALVQAVFERSFGPLNQERLRLLDQVEAAAGDQPPAIEAVLYALFEPMVRTWRENHSFLLLAGRLQYESDDKLRQVILDLYEEVIRRFFSAATRALPDLAEGDVFWWVHFLFTGMVHSLLSSAALEQFSRGVCRGDDACVLDRMITFGAMGFRGGRPGPNRSYPVPPSQPTADPASSPRKESR